MNRYGLIVFNSTHDAIKSEQVLKDRTLQGRLIPTPGTVSAGCGFAWRFLWEDYDAVINSLHEKNVQIANIYKIINETNHYLYEKVI